MDNGGLAAALQDAASLYHNNITPFLQRCASYVAQPSATDAPPILGLAEQRALQHSDNLKWQQDVFHRLLHLVCLVKEGLVSQQQLLSCKRQVLAFLEATHPDGEWPEFTRDKLLFLQDLLFASCITESEYHTAKKPLILRLADQGAIIDAEDFIFDSSSCNDVKIVKTKSTVRTPSARRAKARSIAESDISYPVKSETDPSSKTSSSSPLKQVVGAVCRFNKSPNSAKEGNKPTDMKTDKEASPARVPHALDFLRPEHCPIRDPPSPHHQAFQQRLTDSPASSNKQEEVLSLTRLPPLTDRSSKDEDVCNWLTSPPSSPPKCTVIENGILLEHASPAATKSPMGTPSRFRNVFTGLIQKKPTEGEINKSLLSLQPAKDADARGEFEKPSSNNKGSKWGLEILRFTRKLQFDQEESQVTKPARISKQEAVCEGQTFLLEEGGMRSPSTHMDGDSEGQTLLLEGNRMRGPSKKEPIEKVLYKGAAPTDFIIDKVLGENIKKELSRIRAEMDKSQPDQAFSNEQIDAIATKLPMDKAELKKFFPQTWCEKYGDCVLGVVQREFKEHVGEMQKLGKAKQQHSLSFSHNNENMELSSPPLENHHHHQLPPKRTPDTRKCFTTLNENNPSPNSSNAQLGSSPRKQWQPLFGSNVGSPRSPMLEKSRYKLARKVSRNTTNSAQDNLDHKLEQEILKMPLHKLSEYGSNLRT